MALVSKLAAVALIAGLICPAAEAAPTKSRHRRVA